MTAVERAPFVWIVALLAAPFSAFATTGLLSSCSRHEVAGSHALPVASSAAGTTAAGLAPASAAAPSASVVPPEPFTRAKACPRVLAEKPRAAMPKLEHNPRLLPLLQAGNEGNPRSVRLRFHHPVAYCDCTTFSLTDYDRDKVAESYTGAPWVYVVFPEGVPNGHAFETSKYLGVTSYELVGYFSGREIDHYGWAAIQNDYHDGPIGGEGENDRKARYPEFCVEDWCYRPDPNPVLHKPVMSTQEIAKERAEYASILREMKRAGAKLCPPRP
jgi:hypothetical protein